MKITTNSITSVRIKWGKDLSQSNLVSCFLIYTYSNLDKSLLTNPQHFFVAAVLFWVTERESPT